MKGLKDIQDEILPQLMLGIFVLVFLSLVSYVYSSWNTSRMALIWCFYTPMTGVLGIISFSPRLSGSIRVMFLKVLLFIFGTSELLFYGYGSYAFFLFFAASLIGIAMLNRIHGWVTEFGSILITAIVGLLYSGKIIDPTDFGLEYTAGTNWISPILIYSTISLTLLYVVDQLTLRLGRQLDRGENLRQQLIQEKERLSAANRELEQTAYLDPNTKLPNLRAAERDLRECRERTPDQDILVILLNIESYEQISVRCGIAEANAVLKTIAERLRSLDGYRAYRSQGDRFILSGFRCSIEGTGADILRDIQDLFSIPVPVGDSCIQVQYKGVMGVYSSRGIDLMNFGSNLLLVLLDKKRIRTNQIIDISEGVSEGVLRKQGLMESLEEDTRADRLETYIQPKLDPAGGRIAGGELLLRWESRNYGTVSPEEFIPIAEQQNLILPLTRKVLRDAQQLMEEFRESESRFSLAVNISPAILQEERVEELIEMTRGFSGAVDFEFELTEGSFLQIDDTVRRELNRIHRAGIGISIDDFGTGYSNFEYLQEIRADILKVDKKFLTRLSSDRQQQSLVSAMIAMAGALELKVIVEGVENRSQYDWLASQGVDELQGFLLAPPMRLDSFIDFYKAHDPGFWNNREEALSSVGNPL